jgi:pimeloyl-ACP methyl ester carboxylesterase
MEPSIRYAHTSDGHRIAFYALGEGPPLIVMSPGLGGAIEFDWRQKDIRDVAELSSRFFTYIRYDPRGCGVASLERRRPAQGGRRPLGVEG